MSGKATAFGLLSLALMLGMAGCNTDQDGEFKAQDPGKNVEAPEVEHVHGPHDGHVAELGGDHSMLAEITYKADPREIAVYVLDHDDPSQSVAIEAQSMTLELPGGPLTLSAERQEGDPEGKASKFVVTGQAIPASIKSIEDVEGDLKVDVAGKTLAAEFGHHDDHDHEHEDEHKHEN